MTTKELPRRGWGELRAAALFDEKFYLSSYPDVLESGQDAFSHFLSVGWRERRDPSSDFSSSFYLDSNPDVAAADINPLVHYACEGVFEGRSPLPSIVSTNEKAVVLSALPAHRQALHWQAVPDIGQPLESSDLSRRLLAAFAADCGSFVLSMSHDQYVESVGGVQAVIAAEAKALMIERWTYVHVCPAQPLPLLADSKLVTDDRLVLTLNGRREGVVRATDLIKFLRAHAGVRRAHVVVHHAMGFSAELVVALARACGRVPTYFWTHDFFSLCTNPFLLRNNLRFCGAPSPHSTACSLCNNGSSRPSHLSGVQKIFAALDPVVLSPSSSALDFWKAHTSLKVEATHIVPPALITFEGELRSRDKGALRVAFIGPPASHKGWATFAGLVNRHRDDPRYEFFRLGVGDGKLAGIRSVRVEVTADHPNAMIDALRANAIDVVVNWYSCFETFSFSTHEAMAAGALVVTRFEAGNVWPALCSAPGRRGLALHSEAQLRSMFLGEELIEIASQPRSHGVLRRTSGTTTLLFAEEADRG